MLYYNRIDLGEGINVANSKECIVSHYFFPNHGFKFQRFVCIGWFADVVS